MITSEFQIEIIPIFVFLGCSGLQLQVLPDFISDKRLTCVTLLQWAVGLVCPTHVLWIQKYRAVFNWMCDWRTHTCVSWTEPLCSTRGADDPVWCYKTWTHGLKKKSFFFSPPNRDNVIRRCWCVQTPSCQGQRLEALHTHMHLSSNERSCSERRLWGECLLTNHCVCLTEHHLVPRQGTLDRRPSIKKNP